jgi:hypothetical protein
LGVGGDARWRSRVDLRSGAARLAPHSRGATGGGAAEFVICLSWLAKLSEQGRSC